MSKNNLLKGACLVLAASMIPFSQAQAEVSISGWINEAAIFYDDGDGSDIVQASDNGTTLGSRITFAGSSDLPNTGMTAGFEVILEPQSNAQPLIFSNQDGGGLSSHHLIDAGTVNALGIDQSNTHNIFPLGVSIYVSGAFGKVTIGQQSMPTDNIAVLADPSLTLWSSISPVFRGNGFSIRGLTGAAATSGLLGAAVPGHTTAALWGDFLSCYTDNALVSGAGIGLDCNGTYNQGIRYDLPTFIEGLSIAVGYANDDVYDVAGKWNGELGRMKAILHMGYADNADGGAAVGATDGSQNFQVQGGLMDPVTGLFGTVAYQHEEADGVAAGLTATDGVIEDETDAYWLKVGIKKAFTSLGDTALAFQYGSYNDQYSFLAATVAGVTGSEVERIGFEINQYFGSSLIIYGAYENFDLDVDQSAAGLAAGSYQNADELDIFSLGLTYFF